ncbi:hypothetical protein LJ361_20100 [Brucella sp. JSBI001]|nr:hypothetical protein [Brucella sp. JSBI001]UZD69385.1 hypothetical protein LJ361_20100 [Brucella sp. JSBI001]
MQAGVAGLAVRPPDLGHDHCLVRRRVRSLAEVRQDDVLIIRPRTLGMEVRRVVLVGRLPAIHDTQSAVLAIDGCDLCREGDIGCLAFGLDRRDGDP